MEKLLFFGLTDAEFQKIKPVASRLKLHCEQIPVSMYHNTLGAIASGRAVPAGIPAAPGTPVPASLTAALGADAPIDYKAVLTPTNAGWTIPRLLMEMHSEKAAYTAKNR